MEDRATDSWTTDTALYMNKDSDYSMTFNRDALHMQSVPSGNPYLTQS